MYWMHEYEEPSKSLTDKTVNPYKTKNLDIKKPHHLKCGFDLMVVNRNLSTAAK